MVLSMLILVFREIVCESTTCRLEHNVSTKLIAETSFSFVCFVVNIITS
jgi:hypothetical protein